MTATAKETKEYNNSLEAGADGIGLFQRISKNDKKFFSGSCPSTLQGIVAFPNKNEYGKSFRLTLRNGELNDKGYVQTNFDDEGTTVWVNEQKNNPQVFLDKTGTYEISFVGSDNPKAPKLRMKILK